VPQPSGIITLLTDFGDRDWFVASMKGVILSIQPHATIVDLTHQIPAHAVTDGAYVLQAAYRHFPSGTIHIAVVDPGVGSERRPLIAKASRYFFLAPDNGVLSYALNEEREVEVREISNKQYRLEPQGRTFDGRDVFAPAAAWLACGQPWESFGPIWSEWKTLSVQAPRWEQQTVVGEVVYIDRFGNLISNLTVSHVKEVQRLTKRLEPRIRLGAYIVERFVESYSQGDAEKPCALINGNGMIEVFVKKGSAAQSLRVGRGEPLAIS